MGGYTVPAHAATSTYTVTIDTTEKMFTHSLEWPMIHFTLVGNNNDSDHSGWMLPVRREVVQVTVEEGRRPVLQFRDRELNLGQADLRGKRYLRIGGPVSHPDICGWKSFESRDSGNVGVKLHGSSLDPCLW